MIKQMKLNMAEAKSGTPYFLMHCNNKTEKVGHKIGLTDELVRN